MGNNDADNTHNSIHPSPSIVVNEKLSAPSSSNIFNTMTEADNDVDNSQKNIPSPSVVVDERILVPSPSSISSRSSSHIHISTKDVTGSDINDGVNGVPSPFTGSSGTTTPSSTVQTTPSPTIINTPSSSSNTKSSISVNENEYNLLLLLFFALFFCIAIVATLIKLRTHQQKNQKEPADILLAWIRQLNNKETQEQDRDKIMVVVNESTTNNCTSIESGECLLIKQQINQLEEKLTDRLIILNQFCISSELTKQLNNGLKAVQN